MNHSEAIAELDLYSDPKRAEANAWFFKTGPGEYGYGDKFIGVSMPNLRKVAAKFKDLPHSEVLKLLKSEYHEQRMLALVIWVLQFEKGDEQTKKKIYRAYLANTKYINNWDFVDVSAHKIIGAYLESRDRSILYKLSESDVLWEKRISIISTFWFIKDYDFKDSLNISKQLLADDHDLIHKAVGWMLREIGKKDYEVEVIFLNEYYKEMPRTMLRYAIERFTEDIRQGYLKGTI